MKWTGGGAVSHEERLHKWKEHLKDLLRNSPQVVDELMKKIDIKQR